MIDARQKSLDKARELAGKGKLRRAIVEYRRVLNLQSDDPHSWLKLGELLTRSGDQVAALEAFGEAARGYRARGFASRAIAAYQHILRLAPIAPATHLELGDAYLEDGKRIEAQRHYARAAEIYRERGDSVREVSALRRLAQVDPTDVQNRVRVAQACALAGMPEAANAEFGALCDLLRGERRDRDLLTVAAHWLELRPDQLELRLELSVLYLVCDEPRRAVQVLRPAYDTHPNHLELLSHLARALGAAGQTEHALAVLRRRARLQAAAGQRADSLETYRAMLQLAPTDAEALAATSQSTTARRRLASGTTQHPPSSPSAQQAHRLFLEAEALRRAGEGARAIPLLRRALDFEPGYRRARQVLEQLLAEQTR